MPRQTSRIARTTSVSSGVSRGVDRGSSFTEPLRSNMNSTSAETRGPLPLLHESRAQSGKFSVADRSCLLKSVELFDFIGSTKTNDAPKLISRLLHLLDVPLRHALSLKDQISKNAEIR